MDNERKEWTKKAGLLMLSWHEELGYYMAHRYPIITQNKRKAERKPELGLA
ncbi:hypothetical protein EXN66_Car004579 [Channa argus]|uniref:Uncharacterized protein n=1 Tax=Channa argus TaxID=215402 RepID=A0A6G1PF91_CHAAH|nr:hypothetical protein EXN66_Car004579 [Channa argus]